MRVRRVISATLWTLCPWYLLSFLVGSRVIPFPHLVLIHFWKLLPTLAHHAAASLIRVLAAVAVATVTALPLGLAMGRSDRWNRLFAPAAYLLYPIPKIALLPVLLLTLGTGEISRIVLVGLVLFFQILLAVRDGARSVDDDLLLSVDSLGGGRRERFIHVIWPTVLPRLLTAIRIGSATAIAVLFFAETFFTDAGLGFFIIEGWMRLSYLDMYAGIVGMSLLGLAIFVAIDLIERRVTRWRRNR